MGTSRSCRQCLALISSEQTSKQRIRRADTVVGCARQTWKSKHSPPHSPLDASCQIVPKQLGMCSRGWPLGTLGRIWPTRARFDPHLARTRAKFGSTPVNFAEFGRLTAKLAELDPKLARMGQSWPKSSDRHAGIPTPAAIADPSRNNLATRVRRPLQLRMTPRLCIAFCSRPLPLALTPVFFLATLRAFLG